MTWHFGLVESRDGVIGVHEIYVRDGGIIAITEEPIQLGGFETADEAVRELELIAKDIAAHGIVREVDLDF